MSPKNKYHLQLLQQIKEHSTLPNPDREGFGLKYVGTDKPSYHLDTTATRSIAKQFLKTTSLDLLQYIKVLDSLYAGETYDEINIAAKLVEYAPKLRYQLDPACLDLWLGNVCGWAEVDVLCQMAFTSKDLLDNWTAWLTILTKLNSDPNIHKRRASLVLLTKPVRQSADSRLSVQAFQNIENLKGEKHILITKAVSWLLRSLIKNHHQEVTDYLNANLSSLPKVAIREVTNKLQTGKK